MEGFRSSTSDRTTLGGKKLDCDTATELAIGSLVHLSHAAGSEVTGNFVVCEFDSNHEAD
jgi:hypothetical protein